MRCVRFSVTSPRCSRVVVSTLVHNYTGVDVGNVVLIPHSLNHVVLGGTSLYTVYFNRSISGIKKWR